MNEILVKVNGQDIGIPKDMVGSAAAVFACQRLGISDPELRLRRKATQEWVGDAAVIGTVLRDGEELELLSPRP